MGDVKTAIRLLLKNSRTVLPDALEVLESASDPVKLVKEVLSSSDTDTTISRSLLLEFLRSPKRKPIRKPPTQRKPAPSRGKQRATLLDSLLSKNKTKSISQVKVASKPKTPSNQSQTTITTSLDELTGLHNYESRFKVVREPILSENLVGDINDMVGYFQSRFQKLSKIFKGRNDISGVTKLDNVKKGMKDVTVIGMVTEKNFTTTDKDAEKKIGHIVLEDPNSEDILEVVVTDNTLVEEILHIMNDSVICVKGMVNDKGTFYANDLVLPDVPQRPISAKKKADEPVHAAFLSDIHVGSKGFLNEPMERFIEFLNGEYGDIKHQKLGEHTKYIMFSGDVVDGVGIYPGQQNDLALDSIHDQYNEFARFVDEIPDDVEIVVIPGNHDMVRSAEPQPKISPQYAPDLATFSNVHMLPNPSQVSLHGVETLLYHCTSLPDIMNHIPGMPIEKPVDVMINMLKARHLAPLWGEKTPIATEPEDHLVIDPLPDIFHGGHVHINGYGGYNGVQIVNSGTMQEQTSYQKSLNIDPTPGLVPLINLKTRKPSLIDFMTS